MWPFPGTRNKRSFNFVQQRHFLHNWVFANMHINVACKPSKNLIGRIVYNNFQSIGKLLVLRIYKSAFLALLEEKSHFWKIKDFDGLIFTECSKISDFGKQVIRYYYILTMMATLLFDIQPFITGQLPTACYAPDKWFNFLTVTLWFLSHPVPLSIIGTDGLFISLSISLVIQFRLLSYKFRKLVKNQSEIQLWTDFKELVDYHNSLTRYFLTILECFLTQSEFSVTVKNSIGHFKLSFLSSFSTR